MAQLSSAQLIQELHEIALCRSVDEGSSRLKRCLTDMDSAAPRLARGAVGLEEAVLEVVERIFGEHLVQLAGVQCWLDAVDYCSHEEYENSKVRRASAAPGAATAHSLLPAAHSLPLSLSLSLTFSLSLHSPCLHLPYALCLPASALPGEHCHGRAQPLHSL